MQHPIWYDFEFSGIDPDYGDIYEGEWRGRGRSGQEIAVPCIFSSSDLKVNSPDEMEELKAMIKENGLDAWYFADEYQYYAGKGLNVEDA